MAESYLKQAFEMGMGSLEKKDLIRKIIQRLEANKLLELRRKYVDRGMGKDQQPKKLKKISHKNQENKTKRPASLDPAEVSKKEEEARAFLQKIIIDKKHREKRQREREERERIKLMQEESMIYSKRQQEIQLEEVEKFRRLSEMRSKSLQRKLEIRDLIDIGNHEYKKVANSKPLYEKIEEQYYKKIIMPELNRHKLELARKRELFQPISRSSILKHARKHDLILEEHEIQKLNISHDSSYDPTKLRTKFTQAYIEEQKQKKLNQDKSFLSKKVLSDKKKHYSNLVLQMYTPNIDPAKQLELKMIKERLEGRDFTPKKSAKSLSAKESSVDFEKKKTRKWKKNSMIPSPQAKREPVRVDWLAEQRRVRQDRGDLEEIGKFEWNDDQSSEKMSKQVRDLEEEVRKRELKIEIVNPGNLKGIKETEEISNLLITSIKGKLAILDKESVGY